MHPNKRRSPYTDGVCGNHSLCGLRYPDNENPIELRSIPRESPRFTTRRDHGSPRIGSVPRIIKTVTVPDPDTHDNFGRTHREHHSSARIHTTVNENISSAGALCARALPCIRLHTRKRRPATCDGTWAACVRRAYVASHIPIPHPAPNAQAVISCRSVHARALLTRRLTVPKRDHHRAQTWVCLRSGRGIEIVEDAIRRQGGRGEASDAHAPHAERAALAGHAIRDAKAVVPDV